MGRENKLDNQDELVKNHSVKETPWVEKDIKFKDDHCPLPVMIETDDMVIPVKLKDKGFIMINKELCKDEIPKIDKYFDYPERNKNSNEVFLPTMKFSENILLNHPIFNLHISEGGRQLTSEIKESP